MKKEPGTAAPAAVGDGAGSDTLVNGTSVENVVTVKLEPMQEEGDKSEKPGTQQQQLEAASEFVRVPGAVEGGDEADDMAKGFPMTMPDDSEDSDSDDR